MFFRSFKEFFSFFEVFSFSFDIFDVIGEEVSIAMGLLVPVWLIYEFDAGLFRERREFKVWRSVEFLDSFLFWDVGLSNIFGHEKISIGEDLKFVVSFCCNFCCSTLIIILLPLTLLGFAIGGIVEDWYPNQNIMIIKVAFLLVITGLCLLSFLHQVYVRRTEKIADLAKESFGKTRQENEMFFSLFFYTVTYLSGSERSYDVWFI